MSKCEVVICDVCKRIFEGKISPFNIHTVHANITQDMKNTAASVDVCIQCITDIEEGAPSKAMMFLRAIKFIKKSPETEKKGGD